MTIAQVVAQVLYVASLDLPMPVYWRHVRARKDLMVMLREVERVLYLAAPGGP